MIKGGPKIVEDGLVFCIDAASNRSMGKAGCMGFTSAPQLINNLVSAADTITSTSTLKLANLTYYTIYGLTYPEGSQTPANRDGITPGFNDTSSSKLLDFSRDLNYAVWDNATNSWVADSYFNGERLAGHCYDTYDTAGNAATEHVQFQNDHAAIKSAYPDATHIVVGSHAAENNDANSNTLAILQDLGGPSSWPTDRAEYVLVGKPGLGADNAYVWEYQNNSANVAHANVGLPIVGGKGAGGNYIQFNGSTEWIETADLSSLDLSGDKTLAMWVYLGADSSGCGFAGKAHSTEKGMALAYGWNSQGFQNIAWNSRNAPQLSKDTNRDVQKWVYLAGTQDGSTRYIYAVDAQGTRSASDSGGGTHSWSNQHGLNIGRVASGSNAPNGTRVAAVSVYNKALSSTEILQNYNATKSRFL